MFLKIVNVTNSANPKSGMPFAQKDGALKEVKDFRFWVDDIDLQRRNIRLNLIVVDNQNFATDKKMTTSPLEKVEFVNGYEVIYTQNSIYVCERVSAMPCFLR